MRTSAMSVAIAATRWAIWPTNARKDRSPGEMARAGSRSRLLAKPEIGKRVAPAGAGRPAVGKDSQPERIAQVGSIVPASLEAGALPASTTKLLAFNARADGVNKKLRLLVDSGATDNFCRR